MPLISFGPAAAGVAVGLGPHAASTVPAIKMTAKMVTNFIFIFCFSS
jgi:hypothetical protein